MAGIDVKRENCPAQDEPERLCGDHCRVVRKQIGYRAIDAQHAEAFQKFFTKHFNPYVNYHRPFGWRKSRLWNEALGKGSIRQRTTAHASKN